MTHPALSPSHIAVITGGASGIGLAAAKRFAGLGMKVCIVDRDEERLKTASGELAALTTGGADEVMAVSVDVGDRLAVEALAKSVSQRWGAPNVLMNNAGIGPGSGIFGPEAAWIEILRINLGGIVNGCQVFGPAMIESGKPGLIVNTGSKQGITTPPGDPAYNVSKAGVKAFTEALQHDLRNRDGCQVEARLLIPGFVFTGLTAHGRTQKPEGAWTPEQTVDFMIERLGAGDFYILCPDGEVTREMDERRMLWAMGDIVENRPPLSRWHKDYGEASKAFIGATDRPKIV
ncbi:SDR family NAD(P)-dependent oxidoreductase [Consotaella aegiceratis]|uniref:SDR family NAD(P)-dependent oxidoreductase n=1 Tax=Consotaella aegiceratis TaxID=3097961 RepID=UPI002F41AD5A